MTTKIKYITNRDLLSEIHRSKNSYCSFIHDEFSGYDAIVGDVNSITPELVELTRIKRAAQLMAVERARQKEAGIKNYAIAVPVVDPLSIPISKLVFRVMTYEHIPLDPDRKRKNRNTDQSYTRTNFPPFKHYIIDESELKEVGRSHWCGSVSNGYFDAHGGRMSPHLARMFMMLVERYSRRGNWRGYSYVDEMRSHALLQLSQIGLQFDESKSANPFAFYTTAIKNCFTRILNLEKKNQSIRDDLLMMAGAGPSYTRQVEAHLEHHMEEEQVKTKKMTPAPQKAAA